LSRATAEAVAVWEGATAEAASTLAVEGRVAAETAQAEEAAQRAEAQVEAQARATQQALAEEQARLATSRELSLAAQNNLQIDPERSILLALQAISLARTTQAESTLRQAVVASRVRLAMSGTGAAYSVAYSPDGSRLAVSGEDGVFVRDAASGEVLLTLPGDMVAYSPDGARLATATEDGTTEVWDAASGRQLLALTGHTAYLNELVFSPDGKFLATASADDTVRVWDGTSGRALLTLRSNHVAFSPEGDHLITVEGDATVLSVWDLETGEMLLTLPANGPIAVSPDGKLLVTGAADRLGGLALWDLEASLVSGTGQALTPDTGGNLTTTDLEFSPDGSRLAAGDQDATAIIWTLGPEGLQETLILAGHTDHVWGVSFNPDGRTLATASEDGTARIWDISPSGNREILTRAGHSAGFRRVHYSPDGARLATTDGDGRAAILDAESGETLLTFPHPAGTVWEAVFSPDGTRLATAGEDNTARLWDARTGQALLLDVETGDSVLALQVHPNGLGATRVAFSPDGTRLAAASDERIDGAPLVSVWDLASGQALYTVTGLPNRAWDVAFSPDGSKLVVPVNSDFFKVYDAASGEESLSLTGHPGRLLVVAFSPDGALLAAGGFELPRLWDLDTGQERATLVGHTAMVNGLAFSPDGKRLASSSLDGTTRVYAVHVDELVTLARSRLTRWFTLAECRQYLHMDECPPEP
jgi:WD40 repeat protein